MKHLPGGDLPGFCDYLWMDMLTRLILSVVLAIFILPPGLLRGAEVPVRLNSFSEGGVIRKKVKSLKEMRMRQMIPQSKDFSCGAAALATLFRYYYGQDISEMDAILGMFKHGDQKDIKKRGFSLLDMKKYSQTLNYRAEGYRIPGVDNLKSLTIPVITIVEVNNYKHFIVIRRVDDKYVYIADPSWGNRKFSLPDFKKIWPQSVIFIVEGPTVGTPEGLFVEADASARHVAMVLRKDALLASRAALDPTDTMIYVTKIPLVNINQFLPGVGFKLGR